MYRVSRACRAIGSRRIRISGTDCANIPDQRNYFGRKELFKDGVEVSDLASPILSRLSTANSAMNSFMSRSPSASSYLSMGPSRPTTAISALPKWVEFDKKLLSFAMFFKEAVHEARSENFRVRRCILTYFLEDGSIKINEPKVANSGMPQGMFLKRTVVNRNDGRILQPSEFRVGGEITIFERTYHIVDADVRTRKYFEDVLGVTLAPSEAVPDDPYVASRFEEDNRSHDPRRSLRQPSVAGSRRSDTLGQFLRNDRKVLRFDCLWDEPSRPEESRMFVLHYFLSDDTTEVCERATPNDGRDAYPKLLKRGKLPLSLGRGRDVVDDSGAPVYLSAEHLECGRTIFVYNRPLLLISCDAFTSDFYAHELGIEQRPVNISKPVRKLVRLPPPPYNGFGSEEDSLGSCNTLIPRPPKADLHRFMHNDRKVLRYKARLLSAGDLDRDREFIIAFYLKDETLAVFEPARKNSGFIGGKFLEKGRYRRPVGENGDVERWYKAADFFIGAVVRFIIPGVDAKSAAFVLEDADAYTKNLMEEDKKEFPEAGSEGALERLAAAVSQFRIPCRSAFKDAAEQANLYSNQGLVPMDVFPRLLEKWSRSLAENGFGLHPALTPLDVEAVAAHYRRDVSGVALFAFDEFCDVLTLLQEPEAELAGGVEMRMLRKMQVATRSSEGGFPLSLRAVFRRKDGAGRGLLPWNDVCTIITGHYLVSDLDVIALQETYLRADEVDYLALCDKIYYGNFDNNSVAAARQPQPLRIQAGNIARDAQSLAQVLTSFSAGFSSRRVALRKAFLAFDTSGSATVHRSTFKSVLNNVNPDYGKSQVEILLQFFFPDEYSVIRYDEFMDAMFSRNLSACFVIKNRRERQRLGHVEMTSGQALLEVCAPDRRKLRLSPEQLLCIIREKISARTNSGPLQLRRAFKHFDPDGTGCVDSYEFQKVLLDFNLEIGLEDCTEFISAHDKFGVGSLDYFEFIDSVMEAKG